MRRSTCMTERYQRYRDRITPCQSRDRRAASALTAGGLDVQKNGILQWFQVWTNHQQARIIIKLPQPYFMRSDHTLPSFPFHSPHHSLSLRSKHHRRPSCLCGQAIQTRTAQRRRDRKLSACPTSASCDSTWTGDTSPEMCPHLAHQQRQPGTPSASATGSSRGGGPPQSL